MLSTAERDPRSLPESRRLRSLWDMLDKNARQFFDLAQQINSLRWLINAKIGNSNDFELGHMPIDDRLLIGELKEKLFEVQALCEEFELDAAEVSVQRFLSRLEGRYSPTYGDADAAIKDIASRMSDQLQGRMFLVLSLGDMKLYQPRSPIFGEQFESKFQSVGMFELDEAAKCLSLGRPTAAVFHLMRLLETGIQAVAKCLEIPDPLKPAERNWAIILKNIKEAIDSKWPNAAARMTDDAVLFAGLYASLDAVKNPWRNATMHVENKYTNDEAEHIMIAVKGFLMKLASRCDEDGNPKVQTP